MTEANKEGQTKKPRKMLFSDLSLFLNKDITLILNNDEEVSGTLTFFDEGANCQITNNTQKYFVFGKSIAYVFEQYK